MDKYTKNNTSPDSVKSIPEVVRNKQAYSLLISNRTISFRKKMAERLDKLFIPKIGWKTWKVRFLYPDKTIPKKGCKEIAKAMANIVLWTLQEQVDYLIDQRKDIDDIIEKSLEIINKYKNEQ